MSQTRRYLSLDIGTVRTGVAYADDMVRIAVPHSTLAMGEATFANDIKKIVEFEDINTIVIGYPRNQSGEATEQTAYVERMAEGLKAIGLSIIFQDESLTSVLAEQRLSRQRKPVTKEAIDAEAASIILQDYLERHV